MHISSLFVQDGCTDPSLYFMNVENLHSNYASVLLCYYLMLPPRGSSQQVKTLDAAVYKPLDGVIVPFTKLRI